MLQPAREAMADKLTPLIGVGIDQQQRPEDNFFAHEANSSAKE